MAEAISNRTFPGAVVAYVQGGKRAVLPFGRLTYEPDAPKVNEETVYDVASITKSVATASVILKLIEEGKLTADDPLIQFVPEITCAERERILLRHLLTFTVAFDLPQPLSGYAAQGGRAVLDAIFNAQLQAEPGTKYVYSNAPAILLGLVAARVGGKPLDILADELFYTPLTMRHTTFHPEQLQVAEIAPAEINARGEIKGVTHDESAWALQNVGIAAGSAGLFSTADDLLTFCEMLLHDGTLRGRTYFNPETVVLMHTNQLADIGANAGLGWDVGKRRVMGEHASALCFGKTGFTGGLMLIDPEKQSALAFVTNRTYPKRPANDAAIDEVRRRLADIIFA